MADPVTVLSTMLATGVASAVGNAIANAPPANSQAYQNKRAGILRMLPPHAKSGVMTDLRMHAVTIDGNELRLAPGAMIRNELNMLVLPGMLKGRDSLLVKYQMDPANSVKMVSRIWILNNTEIAALN